MDSGFIAYEMVQKQTFSDNKSFKTIPQNTYNFINENKLCINEMNAIYLYSHSKLNLC